ncbi:hypothetical protein BKI52_39495 [marine bacterium AO1-C]|nr:hypothetical protein BKI52_39495 [marine bacterium AO1-C]
MKNYILGNPELTAKIEQLFFSNDESNVALACELMKTGGVPLSIQGALKDQEAQLFFLINYGLIYPFLEYKHLDISRLGLQNIPQELGQLQSLESLNLFYNQLTLVPPVVCELTTLKTLWLHHNQLAEIPENIDNLTALEELALSFNQLTTLPASLGALTQLNTLYLHHNSLTSLPSELTTLPHLQKITLWNNAFTLEEELLLTEAFAPIELIF